MSDQTIPTALALDLVDGLRRNRLKARALEMAIHGAFHRESDISEALSDMALQIHVDLENLYDRLEEVRAKLT